MLEGALAVRVPEDLPVDFATAQEAELYHRIDTLCTDFYRLADLPAQERAGVGFLIAVFRKRLASSFAAFQKSLERRKALIDAVIANWAEILGVRPALAVEAQEEEDEDEWDAESWQENETQRLRQIANHPKRREALIRERDFLRQYITDLRAVASDSKFEVFQGRLTQVLAEGHRVIVFTQYLDTLDFIRDRLVGRLGNRLACYSGRGGEVWDPASNAWRIVEKAEIKNRTHRHHPQAIRVLLGTDAASEGLNLQQFSNLMNYDLPWNPMRVEQRIGRIDRIGQEAAEVRILNLYVRDTIEEDAYHTLKDRIGVFQEVIGPLQPILAEMPRIFRQVARGEIELQEARRQLAAAAMEKPRTAIASLEVCIKAEQIADPGEERAALPATQTQLAGWCLAHPAPGMGIRSLPEPGLPTVAADGRRACLGITWLNVPAELGIDGTEEILATFDGALADRHPPTGPSQAEDGSVQRGHEGVRLLTWGDPYLHAWLLAVRGEPLTPDDYHTLGLAPEQNPLGE